MVTVDERILLACASVLMMNGCVVTETVQREVNPNVIQRSEPAQARAIQSTQSRRPSLAELTHANAQFHLVRNQTMIHQVEQWWGRAHGQGRSGDLVFLNYTDRSQEHGSFRMTMLTLYFSANGILLDYDLQVHDFKD